MEREDSQTENNSGAIEGCCLAEKRSKDPRQAERSLAAVAQLLDARGDDIRWLVPSHSGAAEGLEPLRDFAARASSSAGH